MVEIDMEDEGGRREMGGRRNNTRRAIYQKYSFNNVCSVVQVAHQQNRMRQISSSLSKFVDLYSPSQIHKSSVNMAEMFHDRMPSVWKAILSLSVTCQMRVIHLHQIHQVWILVFSGFNFHLVNETRERMLVVFEND